MHIDVLKIDREIFVLFLIINISNMITMNYTSTPINTRDEYTKKINHVSKKQYFFSTMGHVVKSPVGASYPEQIRSDCLAAGSGS